MRAASGSDHDGGRGGEAQGARARDDEDRDRIDHGGGEGRKEQPDGEGEGGGDQDAEGEPAADDVGKPGHRSASALRLLHHLNHLLEHGAAPDLLRAVAERAGEIDRAREDGIAGTFVAGQAFAREHGLVERRFAIHKRAIDGNALAGPHHQDVARQNLLDGQFHFRAVAEDAGDGRLQVHEAANGCGGLSAGASFEHTSQQNQGDDGGSRFVVDLVRAAQGFPEGVGKRRAGAQRDEGIHVGGAVAQGLEGSDIEGRAGIEQHREDEGELNPVGIGNMDAAMGHAEDDDRGGEDGSDYEAPAPGGGVAFGADFIAGNAVAEILDGMNEIAGPHLGRMVFDGGSVGGEVDVGALHSRGIGEGALDGAGTGGAGHARYGQVDAVWSRDSHAGTS